MKCALLANSNKKLIIFFNGWGMDETIVSHLDREDYDVLVLYDYRTLDFDLSKYNLEQYSEKYIVAWSMGVMVSTMFDFGKINHSTAINGTLKPIDDNFGIPTKIYKLTVRGFNEKSSQKFMERMFKEKPPIDKFSSRDLESKKEELIALMNYQAKDSKTFDRVIVSDSDNIIPTNNQLNYWQNPEIIESGHCPFFKYNSWKDLL